MHSGESERIETDALGERESKGEREKRKGCTEREDKRDGQRAISNRMCWSVKETEMNRQKKEKDREP